MLLAQMLFDLETLLVFLTLTIFAYVFVSIWSIKILKTENFQLLLHFSHKRHKTAPQLHCCCTSWTAVLLFSPQKTKKCQNQFGIPSLGRDWLLCCSIFHTGGTRQDPSALLLCLLDHGPQFLRSFVLQGSCQSNNSSQIRITSSSWPNKG